MEFISRVDCVFFVSDRFRASFSRGNRNVINPAGETYLLSIAYAEERPRTQLIINLRPCFDTRGKIDEAPEACFVQNQFDL